MTNTSAVPSQLAQQVVLHEPEILPPLVDPVNLAEIREERACDEMEAGWLLAISIFSSEIKHKENQCSM